ncbi:helix-turn-helix transcriptional regulator [Bradyrhizobium sp. CCGUVB23]|uniref:ArsR/SmtB family transcription factor n=1 Tax=Bradyrhizobium sp. CCGUVB23 TaxID=2949630 RepID=UPI0020B1D66D|nr:metalloregulator ArsR/SmtB family transcription factor [Bradyrhizobium sp. CCGUVB23]MCP3464311.1 metalloregulator ArsR/SmtB family transcription factor [Bradyrhizobium sp. CCGUVB23]
MMVARRSVQSGFSRLTEALSDPAREAMVSALFGGKALPAGELASLAGVSPQSASAHLQKLTEARLLSVWRQGRFRYYRIADDEVAGLIENLVNVAIRADHAERMRSVPTPLRQSRACYCHLAGQLGVALRGRSDVPRTDCDAWHRGLPHRAGPGLVLHRGDRLQAGP